MENINHFELNGKLLEISVILNCDVFDLIQVKNQIVENGRANADDIHRLSDLGFKRINEDDFFSVLDSMIKDLSKGETLVTDRYISSLGRKFKKAFEN